jgi:hypothetical protein
MNQYVRNFALVGLADPKKKHASFTGEHDEGVGNVSCGFF